MFIAIDIGNSTTIIANVSDGYKVTNKTIFLNDRTWNAKKICDKIKFIRSSSQNFDKNLEIGISSVVPIKRDVLVNRIKRSFHVQPIIVKVQDVTWFDIEYHPPISLGTDRLCNIIAAIELYDVSCIIVDFGTATTFNVIDQQRKFIGGLISPGIKTMYDSLISSTSLLPEVDLAFPMNVISTNTTQAIQGGLLYFNQCGWEGIIEKIMNETKCEYTIIVTGGASALAIKRSKLSLKSDPHLLLKGIKIFCDKLSGL